MTYSFLIIRLKIEQPRPLYSDQELEIITSMSGRGYNCDIENHKLSIIALWSPKLDYHDISKMTEWKVEHGQVCRCILSHTTLPNDLSDLIT